MFTKIKQFLKNKNVVSFPSSKGIIIAMQYYENQNDTTSKLIQNIPSNITIDKFCKTLQPLLPKIPDSIGVLGCKVLPKSKQYPSDSIYIGLDTDIVDSSFDKLENMLRQKNNQF